MENGRFGLKISIMRYENIWQVLHSGYSRYL